MTTGHEFLATLDGHGVRFLTGVPCSYFASPLRLLAGHGRLTYVPATNEGAALAMAAGSRLAGVPSAVLVQNSGFGNLVNPLTSLVLPYQIPVLVVMSMRGWPAAGPGEPQHRYMGRVCAPWLDSLEVPYWHLVRDGAPFDEVMADAAKTLDSGRTCFVLVGKGAIDPPAGPDAPPSASSGRAGVLRDDLVRALAAQLRDEAVLSTTGYLSRALFTAGDRPRNLYVQGAMGHVASLALGAAMQRPERRFVVLDGDGSLLMHLGSLATIGHRAPENLVHVVFDNGAYESTGAQPMAAAADFAALAQAVGYRYTATVTDATELPEAIRTALAATGPGLLSVAGRVGGPAGGRASESIEVGSLATRFAAALGAGPDA